jgi:hypothetical protein
MNPFKRLCLTALIGLPWAAVLPAQAQAGRIELDALIKLALIPSQATYGVGDWRAGAQPGSPIEWLHAGLEDAEDKGRQDYGVEFPFRRRGVAIVTIDRKPSHEVLGRRVEPGLWDITLLGARAGVMAMSLAPQTGSFAMPDLLGYLKRRTVALVHLKCFNESLMSGQAVYRMSFKGYKPAYLQYSWSSGSGGSWYFLHLSDDDRVLKTPCMGQ